MQALQLGCVRPPHSTCAGSLHSHLQGEAASTSCGRACPSAPPRPAPPQPPLLHARPQGDGEIHFEPALRVISGNYVTAKRRGVIDGVDFGFTGEVGQVRCRQPAQPALRVHDAATGCGGGGEVPLSALELKTGRRRYAARM